MSSDIIKTVVEEFDAEGNLTKRTTTTTEKKPITPWPVWKLPNTLPAYPSTIWNGNVRLYS